MFCNEVLSFWVEMTFSLKYPTKLCIISLNLPHGFTTCTPLKPLFRVVLDEKCCFSESPVHSAKL